MNNIIINIGNIINFQQKPNRQNKLNANTIAELEESILLLILREDRSFYIHMLISIPFSHQQKMDVRYLNAADKRAQWSTIYTTFNAAFDAAKRGAQWSAIYTTFNAAFDAAKRGAQWSAIYTTQPTTLLTAFVTAQQSGTVYVYEYKCCYGVNISVEVTTRYLEQKLI